ncbi:ABC transporter ATP-binding protein [Candidatus Peregrinibacteria bacterium]|nr:ABC transporter ATP-binding protein [Candidatus Peregrinibacteria bacterium]
MPIIEIKKLYKTYYAEEVETPVLHDISFSIEEDEFVAIMGPSGSGKSTLLHILGFLDEQTKGSYRFNGKRMEDYTENEIARIRNNEMGFVFQAFNLLPRTTVYENVKLPLFYSEIPEKEWEKRVMEAIEDVGLGHRTHFDTSRLSGGEKQRVAIARALVLKPEVIFADEPTGNLDSKSGAKIMEILRDLNKKYGHTVILITHETSVAECARRIIQIKDGLVASDHKVKKRFDTRNGLNK